MLNKFPRWRYFLTAAIVLFGLIYALPNIYGDDPALQIKPQVNILSQNKIVIGQDVLKSVQGELADAKIPTKGFLLENNSLIVSFANVNAQSNAKPILQKALGKAYIVAATEQTRTPSWLLSLGASPMKYGLDLRGGVHFLLQAGVNQVINKQIEGEIKGVRRFLMDEKTRFSGIRVIKGRAETQNAQSIVITLKFDSSVEPTLSKLASKYPSFNWYRLKDRPVIRGDLQPQQIERQREAIMSQVIQTLNQRVNQLGVSDATVVQQGTDRVVVDLPGIQDAAQAKSILGETATLSFHIQANVQSSDTESIDDRNGNPVLLYRDVVLSGDKITSANAAMGQQTAGPVINIRLSGDISKFEQATKQAAAARGAMATVFVQDIPKVTKVVKNGQAQTKVSFQEKRTVINVANVLSALGSNFQIQGLQSMESAQNLALLLRAGALSAPLAPLEERVVGPSLGKQNIHMGLEAIIVGFLAIFFFMMVYYSVFGVLADVALFANLLLITALLSILGGTLTLPGIAGIVLTLGMAVDANVLIYERIREELRLGNSIQASLHVGFEKAWSTIVDANVTTLIVVGVLFWIGAGPVQGFAVTTSIGILTSMFTAVTVTRALVNLMYGGRMVKKLHLGIKHKEKA